MRRGAALSPRALTILDDSRGCRAVRARASPDDRRPRAGARHPQQEPRQGGERDGAAGGPAQDQ
eukprot:3456825-Prymnesium_polylepis.1